MNNNQLIRAFEESEGVKLPKYKVVCPLCEGEGTHVNPAVDGNGISADEFYHEWDEESRSMYLNGGYDVQCEECLGKNVVDEVDEDRLQHTPELLKAWQDFQREHYETEAMMAAERAMGA